MESENTSGKHTWLPEEDQVLVDNFVDMKMNNKYISENGFKPGYLQYLEMQLAVMLPGCGLKGIPHIQSRIKTLKGNWQIIYDMVNGINTSGFGWDPITQLVYADGPVWDEYVKVHRKAAPFRTKTFKHYDSLCIVWAKDRATGKESQLADDAIAEDQHHSMQAGDENVAAPSCHHHNETTDVDEAYYDLPTTSRSDATSMHKKRRTRHAESVDSSSLHALKEIFHEATDKLCTAVDRLAHESNMDDIVHHLFEDLFKVPGLTEDEILEAHEKISTNDKWLVTFRTVPDHMKASWIRRRIN